MIGLLLLLTFTADPARATGCEDLHKAWRSKYTVDFRVNWNLKGFQCPGGESNVAQALWDLEHLDLQPNPDGSAPDFYGIVWSRISTFSRDIQNKKDLAYHTPGEITVTPQFYKTERWDRASTLVHEARHEDMDDPQHLTCLAGRNKGQAQGCDRTFWDARWKGSGFNADLFFFAWVQRAREQNELWQAVIQSHINSMVPERFNIITPEQVRKWRR